MKRLSPRTIAATIALFAPILLIGCIPLTPGLRVQLNEYAVGVAHDNKAAGIDDTAEVWCYSEESSPGEDDYIVTAVNSADLLRYGSCRGIIGRGYGAVSCDFTINFCRIFPEPPPATTTVTFVDYGPPQ